MLTVGWRFALAFIYIYIFFGRSSTFVFFSAAIRAAWLGGAGGCDGGEARGGGGSRRGRGGEMEGDGRDGSGGGPASKGRASGWMVATAACSAWQRREHGRRRDKGGVTAGEATQRSWPECDGRWLSAAMEGSQQERRG